MGGLELRLVGRESELEVAADVDVWLVEVGVQDVAVLEWLRLPAAHGDGEGWGGGEGEEHDAGARARQRCGRSGRWLKALASRAVAG